jgi:hypothetical protein
MHVKDGTCVVCARTRLVEGRSLRTRS